MRLFTALSHGSFSHTSWIKGHPASALCPEQPQPVWMTYIQKQPYQDIKTYLTGQPHHTHKTPWYPCTLKHNTPTWHKQAKLSAYLLGWPCFCITKRYSLRRLCITEESPISLPREGAYTSPPPSFVDKKGSMFKHEQVNIWSSPTFN